MMVFSNPGLAVTATPLNSVVSSVVPVHATSVHLAIARLPKTDPTT